VAGLLLVGFFVYLGFPYERMRETLAARLEAATGAQIEIQELGPRLQLAGPGFETRGLRATLQDGAVVRLDRALLRPAWALSWLRGDPALYAELEGPSGEAAGTAVVTGTRSWSGNLRNLDLAQVPVASFVPGARLSGRADARVDLEFAAEGPQGTVTFEAREGSLTLPDVPAPLPYARSVGELVFGGEHLLEVKSLELEGPLLSGKARGTVGRAPDFDSAPLELELEFEAQPAIRTAVQASGVRFGRDGMAKVRIGGTPNRTVVR
jgi:type II secretion system protein N